MMEVEKATAGRMIDRLEANGWVARRTQHDDRRVKRIYLTPEAERVHKRIWRVAEATVEDALTGLSAQESRQLMTLLQRVKKTLVSAVDAAPAGRLPWLPAADLLRAARAATMGRPRHEQAPAAMGADRRAGARPARSADRLAAGRPVRLDRERVRQGGYHPGRGRSARPNYRRARSRPCGRRGRRRAVPSRSGAPTSWPSPRPRPRSIPRAPPSSSSR